ncbi:hypothetical protein [Corallococcus sp. AB038B]|uniref:hypothetical protein n=1 Tax=Corallococcus sp. AB038B TaxID=2316718 RepID=UPI0011C39F60|nr:hypothetical protein [Corallococcus sp. AB038B]
MRAAMCVAGTLMVLGACSRQIPVPELPVAVWYLAANGDCSGIELDGNGELIDPPVLLMLVTGRFIRSPERLVLKLEGVFDGTTEFSVQEPEPGTLTLKTTTGGTMYPPELTLFREQATCRRRIMDDDRRWIAGFAAKRRAKKDLEQAAIELFHQLPLQIVRWRDEHAEVTRSPAQPLPK